MGKKDERTRFLKIHIRMKQLKKKDKRETKKSFIKKGSQMFTIHGITL